jgi:hypothetical protein
MGKIYEESVTYGFDRLSHFLGDDPLVPNRDRIVKLSRLLTNCL